MLSDLSVLIGQLFNLTLTTGNMMRINRDRNNKAVAGENCYERVIITNPHSKAHFWKNSCFLSVSGSLMSVLYVGNT